MGALEPLSPPISVAVFAQSASPGLATVLRAAIDPRRRIELYMPREIARADDEHDITVPTLDRHAGVEWCDWDAARGRCFDVLFFTWSHVLSYSPAALRALSDLAPRAGRVVLLYGSQFGDQRDLQLQQLRLWRRHWRILRHVNLACYMLLPPRRDLMGLLVPRVPLSVGPNLHGLFERDVQAELYRPIEVGLRRPIRLASTGAKHSDPLRGRLCDAIVAALREEANVTLVQAIDEGEPRPRRVLWTMGSSRRPPTSEYVRALGSSDFVLCLPGTSWTHRPFEALVRGAIPILDRGNLAMHDVPWVDGRNCVVVPEAGDPDAWIAAVRRALAATEDEVVKMRTQIAALRASHLELGAFQRRLWAKLSAN